jgi:heat shock protein HslJ
MGSIEGIRHAWVVPLFFVALASCEESQTTESMLADRAFLLDTSEGFEPAAGSNVRLAFGEKELSLYAGCNHHSGAFSVRGDRLVVDGLSSTEMGCGAELHEQDSWLAQFITSSPLFALDGDRLALTGASATLMFLDREVADPDRPLVGPTWSVDTFITGDAASNLPLSVTPTVTFDASGGVAISAVCVTGSGAYTVLGSELALSGVTYTGQACNDSGAQTADEHIRSVLADGTVTFEIEAARMTLRRGNVGIGATTQ